MKRFIALISARKILAGQKDILCCFLWPFGFFLTRFAAKTRLVGRKRFVLMSTPECSQT
ncbi:hypothetical protein OpiT1DRAFT_05201 [Opitutaceae bacterium TAV1]|nr:hypothetical protein OpiT1DRAFT_05201 [Opitutaceae bacterium TAV1]